MKFLRKLKGNSGTKLPESDASTSAGTFSPGLVETVLWHMPWVARDGDSRAVRNSIKKLYKQISYSSVGPCRQVLASRQDLRCSKNTEETSFYHLGLLSICALCPAPWSGNEASAFPEIPLAPLPRNTHRLKDDVNNCTLQLDWFPGILSTARDKLRFLNVGKTDFISGGIAAGTCRS